MIGDYQLRGQNQNGIDTGELRQIASMEEAMEMFLSGNWWKLSWTRPNGHRVRLLLEDKETIKITTLY
jgi:hypothetical protein